jgi:hypothetical protein
MKLTINFDKNMDSEKRALLPLILLSIKRVRVVVMVKDFRTEEIRKFTPLSYLSLTREKGLIRQTESSLFASTNVTWYFLTNISILTLLSSSFHEIPRNNIFTSI